MSSTNAWALVSPQGDVMVTTVTMSMGQSDNISRTHFSGFIEQGWEVRRVSIRVSGSEDAEGSPSRSDDRSEAKSVDTRPERREGDAQPNPMIP